MEVINEVIATQEATSTDHLVGALINGFTQQANLATNDTSGEPALPKCPVLSELVLENLEGKRIAWEVGAYRKSNLELYGILALCLQYSQPLESTDAAKKRNAVLDEFCKTRAYKVTNDTPTATKVIRAVFGRVDRRRTSTYSLVVRAALDTKIKPADMPDWIEKHGGVEEIRLGDKGDQMSAAEQVSEAQKALESQQSIVVIHAEALSLKSNPDNAGKTCLLVAEYQANGDYNVKEIVTADSAVNAALVIIYKAKKAANHEEAKQDMLAA